jgi:regulator of sigma E protease
MSTLISIVAFIVLIFVLVGVHELGHFATARFFGVRVEEFGFGFPPRLWSRRRGQTLYSINAIPLGGFVRLSGENGSIEGPWSFGARPAWQRSVVLAAGAAMNLLLAFVLFFLVYTIAPIPQDVPRVAQIVPRSPAVGVLQPGDLITAVNGTPVASQSDVQDQSACAAGAVTRLTLLRRGRVVEVRLVPRLHPPPGEGRIGYYGSISWSGTDGAGALGQTLAQPGSFFSSLGGMFSHAHCAPEAGVTGPVGIARAAGDAAQAVPDLGAGPVLYLAALVSMNLAFVNLLPFPALDGGRLVIVLLGVARRRRISPAREAMVHLAGFAVLLALILLVSAHDISTWLNGK